MIDQKCSETVNVRTQIFRNAVIDGDCVDAVENPIWIFQHLQKIHLTGAILVRFRLR